MFVANKKKVYEVEIELEESLSISYLERCLIAARSLGSEANQLALL
jgi:hypothetical protein